MSDRRFKTANRALISVLIVLILTVSLQAGAQDKLPDVPLGAIAPADPVFDEILTRGLDIVYADRFSEAVAFFDSVQREYPNHPAAYFYQAATYQSWMASFRINLFNDKLEWNVQKAIEEGNKLIEANPDDPWLNFYVGGAYGYRAFYKFRKFNWIGAYLDGNKGIDNFDVALRKRPDLYDVYLGLGSYHYWRSAKSKFIRIITFWIPDKRDFGLKQVEFAVEHSRYAGTESFFVLVTALIDYKKFDRAYELIDEYVKTVEYPIISGVYIHALLEARREEWAAAEKGFREVLHRLETHPYPSYGYQAESTYWIALALSGQGRREEARAAAEESERLYGMVNDEQEIDGHFYNNGEIKDRLKKLRSELKKGAASR